MATPTQKGVRRGTYNSSDLIEPNLPKSHIEELHLRIDEVLALHSAPRFLEAVVVLLVKIREFEERILVIILLFEA